MTTTTKRELTAAELEFIRMMGLPYIFEAIDEFKKVAADIEEFSYTLSEPKIIRGEYIQFEIPKSTFLYIREIDRRCGPFRGFYESGQTIPVELLVRGTKQRLFFERYFRRKDRYFVRFSGFRQPNLAA